MLVSIRFTANRVYHRRAARSKVKAGHWFGDGSAHTRPCRAFADTGRRGQGIAAIDSIPPTRHCRLHGRLDGWSIGVAYRARGICGRRRCAGPRRAGRSEQCARPRREDHRAQTVAFTESGSALTAGPVAFHASDLQQRDGCPGLFGPAGRGRAEKQAEPAVGAVVAEIAHFHEVGGGAGILAEGRLGRAVILVAPAGPLAFDRQRFGHRAAGGAV
ncbi:MAG: hypothetical protein MZV64_04525 [Ignavibacteriales bacterium]|nr:hypothetical protein [Ignavibacteriales bacterium]